MWARESGAPHDLRAQTGLTVRFFRAPLDSSVFWAWGGSEISAANSTYGRAASIIL